MKQVLLTRLLLALAAVLLAATVARTATPQPAEAAHLVTVTADSGQGRNIAHPLDPPTTAGYWDQPGPWVPELKTIRVYRRGDEFDLTVKLAVAAGWSMVDADVRIVISGPPKLGVPVNFVTVTCSVTYTPPSGNCSGPQTKVTFSSFSGVSPVFRVRWLDPATTDVIVGKYSILTKVTSASLKKGADTSQDCTSGEAACQGMLAPVYVIFNPYRDSGDSDVTRLDLPNAELAFFAIGDDDFDYRPSGRKTATLRPTSRVVFELMMKWVSPLATTSAKVAADEITRQAAGFVPGQWPAVLAMAPRNVPKIIERKNARVPMCGQCNIFGALTTAFDRSVGIPARMITATPSFIVEIRDYWNFHVWTEAWLNEVTPPVAGQQTWSAHDATRGAVDLDPGGPGSKFNAVETLPARRTDDVFRNRFCVSPGSTPKGWATQGDGITAEEVPVTAAYGRPAAAVCNPATVTVTKTYSDASTTAVAGFILICTGGGTIAPSATQSRTGGGTVSWTVTGFSAGASCSVSESTVPAGYVQVSNSCTNANLVLMAGATRTCTIANNALAPLPPQPPGVQPAPPIPPFVRVEPAPDVRFGDALVVQVTYGNPLSSDLPATLDFVLTADFLDDEVYLRTDNAAFSQTESLVIPAGGEVVRTYTISASTYLVNGIFGARASNTLAGVEHGDDESVHVSGSLDVAISGPTSFVPGQTTNLTITVSNGSTATLNDVEVVAEVPDYMQPSATEFTVNLGPNAQQTLSLTVIPPDRLNEVIQVQALSQAGGLALDSMQLGIPPPVGGIVELLSSPSSGGGAAPLEAATVATVVLAIGASAWYARRRFVRR